ncbi:MAG: hypothetical protein V3V28_08665 [Polaribacter sp.]|uniref:hypothetical protein n=1 Tax=Polaribacter sp. TaxID=1920175 RepID=UPI002F35A659
MKITKEINEAASKFFGSNASFSEVFVNKDGEFFTSDNLASNSVGNKKSDYALILKSDVVSKEETKDQKKLLETVKTVEGSMVIITDDKKELTFLKIKDEVREPIEGDEATIDGKPANGEYKYQGSSLSFKEGKLAKIVFEKDATRSIFSKIFSK